MPVYNYIDDTGVIIPDTETLLTDVQTEYKDAFGQELSMNPSSPQGRLMSITVNERESLTRNNAKLGNQINPNQAGGQFLAALCALTGLDIPQATYSYTYEVLNGVPDTLIPAGIQVKNPNNDFIFITQNTVTLDSSGKSLVMVVAQQAGVVPILKDSLTQIVTNFPGLETVTNNGAGLVGIDNPSDVYIRKLRNKTLALQGTRLSAAIQSAVAIVPGYQSHTFRENWKPITRVIDGVTMGPHSIYVCVAGGLDADIAAAILYAKGPGPDFSNGAGIPITVSIMDSISKQVIDVEFDRPSLIAIEIKVTISKNTTVSTPLPLIQQAILNYAAGQLENEPGFEVGEDVSPYEIAGAINIQFPQIFIRNIQLKKSTDISFQNAIIPIAIYEQAIIQASSITVATL